MRKLKIDLSNFKIIAAICLTLVVARIEMHAQVYDFNVLRERVVDDQRVGVVGAATIDTWISSQAANGSWSSLQYGANTNFSTSDNHLYRLWNIAAACSNINDANYNNTNYKDAVKKGLEYWYTANTVDSNWWYNKIYFPQYLGEILIFMREFDDFIPKTSSAGIDEPEILSLFEPSAVNDITSHGTGANAIDIGLHYVYRGLLTENATLLEASRDKLETILSDNIQEDMVYHDHGPQIMISSYGWVFCDGLVRLASYMADSPAAFDVNSGNFNKVLRFIRETQISSTRGSTWDFGVGGRSVSRSSGIGASMNYLEKLAQFIDPDNASIYNDALGRLKGGESADYNVREFNKHYWVSDYTQHARSGYLFTVRNTSNRTVEAETGNGENLKANYFSYGATNILVDGDEYRDIMPYWDWAMIPGTTYPHFTSFPIRSTWGTNYGVTSFVGGVSNGEYGASTLDMNEEGVKAKKAWFFFEDEMVCLGSNISYAGSTNVRTTINQSNLSVASYINELGSTNEVTQSLSGSTYVNTNLNYLRNGKIGYFFPNQGNIKYTMTSQSGTWASINSASGSTATQSGYVLSLWVDHGSAPSNANYSYIVVPGIDSKSKAQSYNMDAVEIIENSGEIQAVYHNTLNIFEAIFYEAGSVDFNGKTITVDKPCAIMLTNNIELTVSSPSQDQSTVSVKLNANGSEETLVVNLPTSSNFKGMSVTENFPQTLGVNDLEKDLMDFKIYPNPTQGIFEIKGNNNQQVFYSVLSVDGKKIEQGHYNGSTIINLSGYKSGMYFLSLRSLETTVTRKIIKY
ncbi:hypothetical protein APS56_13715 [Pseudalgibacter alginicilyticus]|uniref:Secretion system C-terminal sorting domain-containing protein n=1 Tax=Pseudalgibacter alginicilyticus TaxID=1736674 RepID=A0A0P0CIT3_9FLAO|nr:polysaccharide lyase family 8 super-sandwich domain-containing protein [Pseudalgibacter alginicilyticus]ALJ06121.1 hypothetical protein APS56_13715 [Pseudalgibacter alginicilyticus]